LGCHLATFLARAGVGRIGVLDRDLPELINLHRQILFDERDVEQGQPKAEIAARKLRKVNSSLDIEGFVVDLTAVNVERLITGFGVVLDGTDNFETRFLINDACVKKGIPWIYGGVIGTTGMTMNIMPGDGPCLRCLLPEPPPAGSLPTCDTRGILGTAPAAVASLQATEALKILTGSAPSRVLLTLDLWSRTFNSIEVAIDDNCTACRGRSFDFLENEQLF
jgi:adenylyltransferase/sulfurtransferase